MIPPEGLAENVALLRGRLQGLRELRAWLDGWNSHRMHGGRFGDGADAHFFNHFERFVRERFPAAELRRWEDVLAEEAGEGPEGVALFFELFEAFGPGGEARQRLAQKGKHGPAARPRPARPAVPAGDPFAPAPDPDPTLEEVIRGFIDNPKTRPGDGSVDALQVFLRGWAEAAPRAMAGRQARELTPWLRFHAQLSKTGDWSALLRPLTRAGEDLFVALLRAQNALIDRQREVGNKHSGAYGAPVIPTDGDMRGMPVLRVPEGNTDE